MNTKQFIIGMTAILGTIFVLAYGLRVYREVSLKELSQTCETTVSPLGLTSYKVCK